MLPLPRFQRIGADLARWMRRKCEAGALPHAGSRLPVHAFAQRANDVLPKASRQEISEFRPIDD